MSKFLVVYSSRTGNTRRVAEAVAAILPQGTPCLTTEEAPEIFAEYGCVFLGFWLDRGHIDAAAEKILTRLDAPKAALFMTLGALPDSPHAKEVMEKTVEQLPDQVTCLGTFCCQGKIDPKLIEQMYKMFPPGSPHGKSPERDALHAEAAKHPDEQDLERAKAFATQVADKVG